MANSLLNRVNNLSEGIHKVKLKYGHNDKKCGTCGIKYTYWEHKSLCSNKNCQQKFDEKIKERFFNTCKFSNHISIKKNSTKFNKTALPEN